MELNACFGMPCLTVFEHVEERRFFPLASFRFSVPAFSHQVCSRASPFKMLIIMCVY